MDTPRFARFRAGPRPAVVDGLIVLGLIAGGFAYAWPGYLPRIEQLPYVNWGWFGGPLLLAIVAPLPLLVRRTHPVAVLAAAVGMFVANLFLDREVATPALIVFLAAYAVGRYEHSRSLSVASTVVVIVLGVSASIASDGVTIWLGFMIGAFLGLWLTGDSARSRELQSDQLEERAARLEANQRAEAARAAEAERSRIARELHDVIAHNVSVMVVQAAAAQRVIARDPAQARASLETIETTGREALTEMRRLLGVLRSAEPGDSDPQPSLAMLPALVDEMRAAGLPVELVVDGDQSDLPPGVDLSAYRIIQEALTNALRHAGATATLVTVRRSGDALELEIVDQGPRPGAAPEAGPAAAGHGLVGMRERIALVRGELEAGPRPEGGFRVRARLPVEPA